MEQETPEFFKLDSVDKKVLFWMMDNKPEEIKSWVMHIEHNYRYADKSIDPIKLFNEIAKEVDSQN